MGKATQLSDHSVSFVIFSVANVLLMQFCVLRNFVQGLLEVSFRLPRLVLAKTNHSLLVQIEDFFTLTPEVKRVCLDGTRSERSAGNLRSGHIDIEMHGLRLRAFFPHSDLLGGHRERLARNDAFFLDLGPESAEIVHF